MDFIRVPRPVQSGPTGGGRKATPSEFQDVVNQLSLDDREAVQVFAPFKDGEDMDSLTGRVCRSLVKAGKAHPSGPYTVQRRFALSADGQGADVTIWLSPLQTRSRNTTGDAPA